MTALKVLVVGRDNHARTPIMQILSRQPSFEVIAQAESVMEAITYTYLTYPDLVLLQAGVPGVREMDVSGWMKRFAPGSKVVFVSQRGVEAHESNDDAAENDGYLNVGTLEQELPVFLEKFKKARCGRDLTANLAKEEA